jgi:hypothetical protein
MYEHGYFEGKKIHNEIVRKICLLHWNKLFCYVHWSTREKHNGFEFG